MDSLAAVADEHGILCHADARRAGIEPPELARLARTGSLLRLARGWYAVATPESREDRHVLLTRAMLRSHDDRAVASHHSALIVLGLPTWQADLSRCRLSRLTPGSPRTRSGLSLGRQIPLEWVAETRNGKVETVRAALACAQVGFSGGPMATLIAADAALAKKLATPEELADAAWLVRDYPRSALVVAMLARSDGRHQSPGETRLAEALRTLGIVATPQFEVAETGIHAFVDFLIEDEGVVIEFDGRVKYGRDLDVVDSAGNPVPPGERVWLEKRREDALRDLDYEVVRVTWSELSDLPALRRKIDVAIQRARSRRSHRRRA